MATATGDNLDLSGRGPAQDPSAVDPIRPHAGDNLAGGVDALNDPFQHDGLIDGVFRDTNDDDALVNSRNQEDEEDNLGITKEVKVRKQRPKQAKLDEPRLLSDKGIPKLRKISKEQLKFRGKGHEFSDVAMLLSHYQLWLDDLFPKAKFADGLTIIEKLGHSRRMQIMRKEWIDEDKPKPVEPEILDEDGDPTAAVEQPHMPTHRADSESNHGMQTSPLTEAQSAETMDTGDVENDPLTTPSSPQMVSVEDRSNVDPDPARAEEAIPEGDELDQLLAEGPQGPVAVSEDYSRPFQGGQFDDDEEAIADTGMDW